MVVVVERKEKGRAMVFYLCPQAIMRGRGDGRKNILWSGEGKKLRSPIISPPQNPQIMNGPLTRSARLSCLHFIIQKPSWNYFSHVWMAWDHWLHIAGKRRKKISERSEPSPQSTPWPALLGDFFSCLPFDPSEEPWSQCVNGLEALWFSHWRKSYLV